MLECSCRVEHILSIPSALSSKIVPSCVSANHNTIGIRAQHRSKGCDTRATRGDLSTVFSFRGTLHENEEKYLKALLSTGRGSTHKYYLTMAIVSISSPSDRRTCLERSRSTSDLNAYLRANGSRGKSASTAMEMNCCHSQAHSAMCNPHSSERRICGVLMLMVDALDTPVTKGRTWVLQVYSWPLNCSSGAWKLRSNCCATCSTRGCVGRSCGFKQDCRVARATARDTPPTDAEMPIRSI